MKKMGKLILALLVISGVWMAFEFMRAPELPVCGWPDNEEDDEIMDEDILKED